MIIKAGGKNKVQRFGVEKTPVEGGKTTNSGEHELSEFDEKAALTQNAILDDSTAGVTYGNRQSQSNMASVKFMITMQDEEGLRKLGYSQAQIDKIKPQEAMDILQSGMKFEAGNKK